MRKADAPAWLRSAMRNERLLPELALHHRRIDGIEIINHPLLLSSPHAAHLNAQANAEFLRRQQALFIAEEQRDWLTAIFLHERSFRLAALRSYSSRIRDRAEWWALVRQVWLDANDAWERRRIWRAIFRQSDSKLMMNADERRSLDAMPVRFAIFRGASTLPRLKDFSCSLTYARAHWFAVQYRSGWLRSGIVPKSKVLALIRSPISEEVLVFAQDIEQVQIERVHARSRRSR